MLKDIVSRICNACINEGLECDRKVWNDNKIPSPPRITALQKCPLMDFEAEEDKDKRPWFEKMRDGTLPKPITSEETWLVCQSCQYGEVKKDKINISKHFYTICIECPNKELRDAIDECAAEAET